MKLLLGVLMVLMASGDDMETIDGFLGRDVRLSCTCLDRNLAKDFKWQQGPNLIYILYSNNISKHGERYKDRVQTFLHENITNCSILLKNVTAEDQGEYKCIFHQGGLYKYSLFNLTVFSQRSIHHHPKHLSDDERVFQCDVKGADNDTVIGWTRDGKDLENSPMIKISTTYTQHAPTGLFNFKSELKTKHNWTSDPECKIMLPSPEDYVSPFVQLIVDRTHSYTLFPLLLVVGCFLILCYHWKYRVSARTSEV